MNIQYTSFAGFQRIYDVKLQSYITLVVLCVCMFYWRFVMRRREGGEGGSLLVLELVGEPVEPLVEPVPTGGACSLDVPVALAQGVQA